MAITTTQQQDLLKLGVGMFNASLGGYIGDLAAAVAPATGTGMTIAQLYDTLANSTAFKGLNFAYSSASTNGQFATYYAGQVLGTSVSAANVTVAATYIQSLLDGGMSRGAAMKTAVDFLAGAAALADTTWGPAAQQFVNKVTVATDYTITKSGTATSVATLQNTIASVTSSAASVTAAISGSTAVTPGSTFTLTTGTDNFTGTSGDDLFIGDFGAGTSQASDQINAGVGNDILKLYGTFDATKVPAFTNFETLDIVAGADAAVDASGYAVTKFVMEDAKLLNAKTLTTTNGQSLSLGSSAATAGAVTWAAGATDTTANLTLTGFTHLVGGAFTITGAKTTTLNINTTATSNAAWLTLPATDTKLVFTGAGAFTDTKTVGAALTTIDASGATGAVTLNVDDTNAALTFTGGSGNDAITFAAANTFSTTDSVDGGAGTDTLQMNAAQAQNLAKAYTNIKNFETLKITDATAAASTIDLDYFGMQSISFVAAATATTTVKNIASGATLSMGTASGVQLVAKNDTSSDSLTMKVSGAAVTYTVDATLFEKLTIDTSAATAASTFALTDPQLQTVTLKNLTSTGTSPDFAVNLGTLGVVTNTVDASAFTAATAANGVTVTLSNAAVNGATVTGSGNDDTIVGSSQVDTIKPGGGIDTVTSGLGADAIDLTETTSKADTLKFAESGAVNVDTVTGYKAGTDIISVSIGNIAEGSSNFTLSTIFGADIAAGIAANAMTVASVAVDTSATLADATNLIFLSNTAATSYATAIGIASVNDTTGGNTAGIASPEGVAAVYYDSAKSQAVYGYIVDTATAGTALTSADTFHEIARVGMVNTDYTLANIKAGFSMF